MIERLIKREIDFFIVFFIILMIISFTTGCSRNVKLRPSPYFGQLSMRFLSPSDLGEFCTNHTCSNGGFEKVGMLYTCNAGFIDLGHLRECADRTRYCFDQIKTALELKKPNFCFDLIEPATYFVYITYPSNWDKQNTKTKEKISRELSADLAQYIAFRSTIYHEIITWYGWSCVGLFPETPSSFSPEDLYSDLLGSRLACSVLKQDCVLDFNMEMKGLLSKEIRRLEARQKEVAKMAYDSAKGHWFNGAGYPFIEMKKRNFDIGQSGFLTPWLVAGICSGKAEPQEVPNLKTISKHGFSFRVEIATRGGQGTRLQRIAGSNRINPELHYNKIVEYIRQDAIRKKGINVDNPYR